MKKREEIIFIGKREESLPKIKDFEKMIKNEIRPHPGFFVSAVLLKFDDNMVMGPAFLKKCYEIIENEIWHQKRSYYTLFFKGTPPLKTKRYEISRNGFLYPIAKQILAEKKFYRFLTPTGWPVISENPVFFVF